MSTPKKSTTKRSSMAKRGGPATFFLVVALVAGLVFAFLTPPFQVPDEQAHFARAYQVSQGGLISEHIDQGVGGKLPESVMTTANDLIGKLPGRTDQKITPEFIVSQLNTPLKPDKIAHVHFENTALYSPIMYAPAAVGIRLTSLFDTSPLVLFYAARIFTVLAWIGMAYAAIRLIPVAKWAFAVLALAPMAVFQGASVSADALTLGFCMLAVAWFMRLALQKQQITRKQWLATILFLLILGLVKQPYALLGLLFVCMPAVRFSRPWRRWQFVGSAFAALSIGMLSWYLIAKGLFAQSPFLLDRTLMPDEQLAYVFDHPWQYIKASLFTHWTALGDGVVQEFVGVFGWLDTKLPMGVVLGYLVCLALALSAPKDQPRLRRPQLWVGVGIAAAIVAIVDLLLYMYWNAVGAVTIMGIQGRYYLMVAPLVLALLWGSYEVKTRRFAPHIIACAGVVLVLTISIITVARRFY